jgi:hypothetical protein
MGSSHIRTPSCISHGSISILPTPVRPIVRAPALNSPDLEAIEHEIGTRPIQGSLANSHQIQGTATPSQLLKPQRTQPQGDSNNSALIVQLAVVTKTQYPSPKAK